MLNISKKNLFFPVGILVGIIGMYYISTIIDDGAKRDRTSSLSVTQGQNAFDRYCASCHDIKSDGIGPRLGGITRLLTPDSLRLFIKNPGLAIQADNSRAQLQQQKYRQQMPPFSDLSDSILNNIIAFIDHQTKTFAMNPLSMDEIELVKPQHLVTPVKSSKVCVILEDWQQIPRSKGRPPDKGIATLRTHPSGDGTLFVSDQMGVIYRLQDHKIDTFLYLSHEMQDFIFEPGIGTGLGSFTFHPDFTSNGLFYTTHTETYNGQSAINDGGWPDSIGIGLQWVLTEWKMEDIKDHHFTGAKREVLRLNTPTTAHGVQDIGFAPHTDKDNPDYGKLYLGIGDGGSNNIKHPELCHNLQSLLGTILRINPLAGEAGEKRYKIPRDNPFFDDPNPNTLKEIWAYGFRNPHRLSWNEQDGKMLVADIGESNIEELNIVVKGGDYGWPDIEGSFGISTRVNLKSVYAIDHEQLSQYRLPFAQYDHLDGNAISGGYVYQGPLEALQHKYIFGDIVNGRLFFVDMVSSIKDASVYEIHVMSKGRKTDLKEITQANRIHLRIGYDPYDQELFVMTKGDGMIRKIAQAYVEENL